LGGAQLGGHEPAETVQKYADAALVVAATMVDCMIGKSG
jgi:hypothetical protein